MDDWQKYTDYRTYSAEDQIVKWFWQLVRTWDTEKKARLLQFVTGTSRVPISGDVVLDVDFRINSRRAP